MNVTSSSSVSLVSQIGDYGNVKSDAACISGGQLLFTPSGVSVSRDGNNYKFIADTISNHILKFNSSNLLVATYTSANNISYNAPNAVAPGNNGEFIVADTGNNRLVKFDSTGTVVWSVNTINSIALNSPRYIYVLTSDGSIYFADSGSNRGQSSERDRVA